MLKDMDLREAMMSSPEDLIFRQPYLPGVVVSTLSRERGEKVRSSYSHPRNTKRITIDDSPIMLLPRAQIRANFDVNTLRRMFTTVPENGYQDLQLSTISVSDWMDRDPERTGKSALRTSRARRKSDADSGISSLKRCVTFENISEPSLNRSTDDISTCSKDGDGFRDSDDADSVLSTNSQDGDMRFDDLPEHLDSFGDSNVLHVSKKKKRHNNLQQTKTDSKHHPEDCNECAQCRKDELRMQKYFGGVDFFLDWIISKWGKRKELQVLTKSNFLIRGLKPHFCNFVHGMNLHERDINERSRHRGGQGDDTDGDGHLTIGESGDSLSLGHWRRGSSGSGIEGRPASPSSIGDDDKTSKDTNSTWPRSIYGSKTKGAKADEKSKEDKENEIQTYIMIPPPETPKDPKPSWKEQSKVKKSKSSSHKKGGKSGGKGLLKDSGAGGEGDGSEEKGGRKGRSCVKKKEKKTLDRHRGMNQDTEPQVEPVTTIVEEKKTPEPEKTESDNYHTEVKVPELPISTTTDKEKEEKAGRVRRNLIEAEFLRSDANEVLNQEMRDHHREFEFDTDSMSDDTSKITEPFSEFSDDYFSDSYDDSNRVRMSSWLTGRLALSQQSSRFTLPMDMKILEKMSPQEYLRKYCVISSRRHILYQKIFSKNRDKTGIIPYKDIEKALKDVLVNTISHDEVADICELLEITEETHLDYQLFCGIAAFAERILYPKFVTEDTAELAEFQREKIECADFCALDWKFHGVNVNPPVKKMLKSLG